MEVLYSVAPQLTSMVVDEFERRIVKLDCDLRIKNCVNGIGIPKIVEN